MIEDAVGVELVNTLDSRANNEVAALELVEHEVVEFTLATKKELKHRKFLLQGEKGFLG